MCSYVPASMSMSACMYCVCNCDRKSVCVGANLNTVQPGVKWSSLVDMLQYHIVVLCSHFVFSSYQSRPAPRASLSYVLRLWCDRTAHAAQFQGVSRVSDETHKPGTLRKNGIITSFQARGNSHQRSKAAHCKRSCIIYWISWSFLINLTQMYKFYLMYCTEFI